MFGTFYREILLEIYAKLFLFERGIKTQILCFLLLIMTLFERITLCFPQYFINELLEKLHSYAKWNYFVIDTCLTFDKISIQRRR